MQRAHITKIEFTSLARGYDEKMIITQDSILVFKPNIEDRYRVDKFSRITKEQDWKHLLNSLRKIGLSEFENLKSPTNKRAFDGARHSNIIITTSNQEIHQHTFDNEDPHEKLAQVMRCIALLRDKTITQQ